MGYTFKIGNATPKFDKTSFPELYADWEVDAVTHPDAPEFPNDEMTDKSNVRSPSYTVWSDFARQTGLYEFFYNERGHLHAGHPGCIGITTEDVDLVAATLARYRRGATLPPGFEKWDYEGPQRYDYHLARLIWLEWWMRWAVENCETPAIENS